MTSPKRTANSKIEVGVSPLPKLGKIQTTWNLKEHYYTSEHDPRIEADLTHIEKEHARFAKKYRGRDFTSSPMLLKKALTEYEIMYALPHKRRVTRYFSYRSTLNAKDAVAEKRLNLYSDRLIKSGNALIFFELAIGKIPVATQKQYLKNPVLKDFTYYLSQIFEDAKHTLTESEEKILRLKSNTSFGMWVDGTEKIISNRMLRHGKNDISMPEALALLETTPGKRKQKLWDAICDELAQISEVAENEFNAIVNDKKTTDELRGYETPYEETVLSYENETKSVEALIEAVSKRGFALSSSFYTLKAKLHGLKKLPYVLRNEPIGKPRKIPFAEAVEVCRETFYGLKTEYGAFFDMMLTKGHIDVYPRAGKRSGAFMSAGVNVPTYVMLNHTDTFGALETLAHEMGHAIHAERSKTQQPLYEGHSITTAETASTLFENIVFNKILKTATKEERVILLHDRILRDISTIQRQIAFFNFELDLHNSIREHGAATKEEMTKMMQKHLKSYLGPSVEVTERDGLSFVYISHFRYGFYVYTYAYGLLMSSIMARRLSEDTSYKDRIDAFLSAGGSDTVENIFGSIGINARDPKTFAQSLDVIEADILELKKLIHDAK
jgi:oligoendopeptidase F